MASSSEEKGNSIWSLLPSFDPAVDNVREYVEKVRFIEGVCPDRDKAMLAPRLAMLCKGTAWGQVKALDAESLTNKTEGVKNLLKALSSWEESAEMKTYELFEKALYKTNQKADESTTSFVNRLQVAMDELGVVDVKQFHAFLLLRQSALGVEDRKRVLTMTAGDMKVSKVEQAMRTLATSVLSSGAEPKKRVYPTNYVEPEVEQDANMATTYQVVYEDDEIDAETLEKMAQNGDSDALNMVSFEKDLEELFQEVPDLQHALVSYHEARTKIMEKKKKSRGFWPPYKGKNKGGFSKGFKKGSGKGGLLARIARTNCRACGEKGHWKAECPHKGTNNTQDNVNLAMHQEHRFTMPNNDQDAQVIFESITEDDEEIQSFATHWEDWDKSGDHKIMGITWGDNDNGVKSMPEREDHTQVDIPIHHAYCLHECIPRVQEFFAHRLLHRKSPGPMKPNSTDVECLHSSLDMENVKQAGLAILDTGASRSVVGHDVLPHVLKSLPPCVRNQIKEKSSNIGFRFGNNQVTYSQKQVHIPIFTATQKIWIVIEVVPAATPFLLSIQAMKMLGAQINLSNNHCYLTRIDRQLNLQESKNGLYLISMSELCLPVKPRHQQSFTAEADRAPSFFPPPGLTLSSCVHHANTGRSHAHDQEHGRGHHGVIAPVAGDTDEPVGGESTGPGDCDGSCPGVVEPSERGSEPEGTHRATVKDAAGQDFVRLTKKSQERWIKQKFRDWRPVGRFMGSGGTGDGKFGPNAHHQHECEPAPVDGPPPEDAQAVHSCPELSTKNHCSSDRAERCAREPDSPHGPGIGVMGQQKSLVGQDPQWVPLLRSVRAAPKLRGLDFGKIRNGQRRHAGLHHVCPSSRSPGTSSTESQRVNAAPKEPTYDDLLIENGDEMKWLMNCIHHMPRRTRRIDLLEVYTEPNSKLVDEVRKQGGQAVRFTRDDGDLSTHAGQVALLRKIFLLNPLAPECCPWGPWSRFNQMRGITAFNRVQEDRSQAQTHLRLCDLIFKIQISKGDHCHVENPGPSSIWHQKEFERICRCTKPAFFDQCAFQLKHPETGELMKKNTRVQTSSEKVWKALDSRFCNRNHEHAQIAGSCHFRGHCIPLSQFASFYPTALAKSIAKAVMSPMPDPLDLPSAAFVHDGFPAVEVEEPPKKKSRFQVPRGLKREHQEEEPPRLGDDTWNEIMNSLRQSLPKSGVKQWDGPHQELIKKIQSLCPEHQIQGVMACKGREKFMTHPDNLSHRRTIVTSRGKHEVHDLGWEDLREMSKNQRNRKAFPSHVMVCVFGRPIEAGASNSEPARSAPEPPRETEDTMMFQWTNRIPWKSRVTT